MEEVLKIREITIKMTEIIKTPKQKKQHQALTCKSFLPFAPFPPKTFAVTHHDISKHGCILRTRPRNDLRHVWYEGSMLGT